MSDSLRPHELYSPRNSLGQDTGVGSLSLLQGIFPTQGSKPGLPHCRWILYQVNYQGSLRILEWVAYPFSSTSAQPRNWTRVSWVADIFFTNWSILSRWAQCNHKGLFKWKMEAAESASEWCSLRKTQPAIASFEDRRTQIKEYRWLLEAGRSKEIDSPVDPSERRLPCQHLHFSPLRPIPDLRPPEL